MMNGNKIGKWQLSVGWLIFLLATCWACGSSSPEGQAKIILTAAQKKDLKTIINLDYSYWKYISGLKKSNPKTMWPQLIEEAYNERVKLFRNNYQYWPLTKYLEYPCDVSIIEYKKNISESRGNLRELYDVFATVEYNQVDKSPLNDEQYVKKAIIKLTIEKETGCWVDSEIVPKSFNYWDVKEALYLKVISVRFFEGGSPPPPVEQRKFERTFDRYDSRYIYWQLDIDVLKPRQSDIKVPITYEWFRPDGELLTKKTFEANVKRDWKDCYFYEGQGIGRIIGQYKIVFKIQGKEIAQGTFDLQEHAKASQALHDTKQVFLENFGKYGLSPQWKIVRSDPKYYATSSNYLNIWTLQGDLWQWENNYKNLFIIPNPLYASQKNFQVTMKVNNFNPVTNQQQIAIVAYNDDDNHVRCGHGFINGSKKWKLGKEESGNYSGLQNSTSAQNQNFWLKLVKQGNTYTQYYSLDGASFDLANSITSTIAYPKFLGFIALQGGFCTAPPVPVFIDFFRVDEITPSGERTTGISKFQANNLYRIRNRWKNNLYLNIEPGNIQASPIEMGWLSAQWVLEPIPGTQFHRIKNRWKNNQYIHIEYGTIQSGPIEMGWHSAQWILEPIAGTAYQKIKNRWKSDQYINIENGYIQSSPIQIDWHSAQWVLEESH